MGLSVMSEFPINQGTITFDILVSGQVKTSGALVLSSGQVKQVSFNRGDIPFNPGNFIQINVTSSSIAKNHLTMTLDYEQ